jgi:hypothetical protein
MRSRWAEWLTVAAGLALLVGALVIVGLAIFVGE